MKNENAPGLHPQEIPLGMYEVPGQDSVTPHSFERYKKSREDDASIAREVRNSASEIIARKEAFYKLPEKSRPEEIVRMLRDADPKIMQAAAELIQSTRKNDQRPLYDALGMRFFKIISQSKFERDFSSCMKAIPYLLPNDCVRAFTVCSQKPELREKIFEYLPALPEEARTRFIIEGLKDKNPAVRKHSAQAIFLSAGENAFALVDAAIKGADDAARKTAAASISILPERERNFTAKSLLRFIDDTFNETDVRAKKNALELLPYIPKDERMKFVLLALSDQDSSLSAAGIASIALCDGKNRDVLWKDTEHLLDGIFEGGEKSEILDILHASRTFPVGLAEKTLLRAFDTCEPEILLAAAENPYAKQPLFREKIGSAIVSFLDSGERDKISAALALVRHASPTDKEELLNKIQSGGHAKELIESPLYKHSSFLSEKFGREAFEKTGSATTLLGGALQGKAIIRAVEPEAFQNWQTAFEDHEMWKNSGFDYVPIEPIISYSYDPKSGLVNVSSGVLDLNLEEWMQISDRFKDDLLREKNRILHLIDASGIEHGHPHNRNFCLRFFRDETGNVDLSLLPRLYLIDFDQALSR